MPESNAAMTPERWDIIREALRTACEMQRDHLADYLAELEHRDPALRAEVESLLAAQAQMGDFISTPVFTSAHSRSESAGTPTSGQWIGPYRINDELGRGGMGVVYRAERADQEYEKQVAIKFLKLDFFAPDSESKGLVLRFRSERQILATLDHPNITRLLDGGTTPEGQPYLVMEHVTGKPIDEYCNAHQLDIKARLHLFLQVCEAVVYAHKHMIVHRDLKPRNILVTESGVPKLLDFGIAKLLQPDASVAEITATDFRPMTPAYASPEQVRGKHITTATDVYSLGVVLYELLTGEHPYQLEGCSADEAARIICEQQPTRPSTLDRETERQREGEKERQSARSCSESPSLRPSFSLSQLRGDLDNIVLTALRKEPERRYGSVRELAEDIERYLNGLPVKARPNTIRYLTAKFVRRNKAVVAASALVLLTLLGGIVATAREAQIARAALQHAERERTRAEAQRALAEQAKTQAIAQQHRAEREEMRAEQARTQAVTQQHRAELEQQRAQTALASAQQERERAEVEKSRAERRFHDVRKLANAMLFDLHDEIDGLTGATKARALLVKIAHEYLESLANETGDDLSLQQELARAYVKLGDVQGNSRSGELGDKPAALASYRRALEIQHHLVQTRGASVQARHELALNHSKLAEASEAVEHRAEAIAHARQSLTLLSELLAENPEDGRIFHDCFYQYHQLCDLFRKSGENVDALAHTRKAIALMKPHIQKADATESGEMLYNDHQRFALMLREVGDLEEALRHYGQALNLAQETAVKAPNDFDVKYVQSDIHRGIAITLTRKKDFPGALEHYQRGHEIMASLSQLDPANIRLLHRLSQSHGNIADAFALVNDNAQAQNHLRQAVTMEETLIAKVPSRSPISLADRLKALADTVRSNGNYQDALNYYEQALRVMEPMVAQPPTDKLARRRLGIYHAYIGLCQLKIGKTEAAKEPLNLMLQVREELRAADRGKPT